MGIVDGVGKTVAICLAANTDVETLLGVAKGANRELLLRWTHVGDVSGATDLTEGSAYRKRSKISQEQPRGRKDGRDEQLWKSSAYDRWILSRSSYVLLASLKREPRMESQSLYHFSNS